MDGDVCGRPFRGVRIVKSRSLPHDECSGKDGGWAGVRIRTIEGHDAAGNHAEVGTIPPIHREATGALHSAGDGAVADEAGDSVQGDGTAQSAMKKRSLIDDYRVVEFALVGQCAEVVQRDRTGAETAGVSHVDLAAADDRATAVGVPVVDLEDSVVDVMEVDAGDVGVTGASQNQRVRT